ncbi:MAG: aspartate dehydrogenase [Lachnospiraceae bacterium]|nr:aspartate dehydrogenase [Lachnospiraceae bacterium]
MFKRKAKTAASCAIAYDRKNQIPVLKCSICNGEQVAGFKNIHTGKFEEAAFIRNDADLAAFLEKYGVEAIQKEY